MAGGRPIKKGLDYFNIDTSIGDKVKYLVQKCDMDGYGIFVFILARIYKTEGYYCRWDERAQVLFCDNGIKLVRLKEVVECCFEIGLFNRDIFNKYSILTSAEIQKRYLNIIHICKRKGISIHSKLILSSEETHLSSEETLFNTPEFSPILPQHTEEVMVVNSEETAQNSELIPSNPIFIDKYSEETAQNSEETAQNSESNTQSKAKESKEKKKKEKEIFKISKNEILIKNGFDKKEIIEQEKKKLKIKWKKIKK